MIDSDSISNALKDFFTLSQWKSDISGQYSYFPHGRRFYLEKKLCQTFFTDSDSNPLFYDVTFL